MEKSPPRVTMPIPTGPNKNKGIPPPRWKEGSAKTSPGNTCNGIPEYFVPSFKYNPEFLCSQCSCPFCWPAHTHHFGSEFSFFHLINPLFVWLCFRGLFLHPVMPPCNYTRTLSFSCNTPNDGASGQESCD